MDLDFANLMAEQIAAAMKGKKISPAELGDTLFRRSTRAQKELNLFISFDQKHIAGEIKRIEQHLPDKNCSLLGVPLALADNIATDDQKTTCASRFMAAYQPPFTARVVSQLKENGALLIGKTNLEEFNLGCSGGSSFFNSVKNPWDLECSAGSGAAAAVASGLATLALASDTRGELRQAASYCGVLALKPTYGRISRKGLIDIASSLEQIGILGRCTSDLAIALQVLAVPEPDNPSTLQIEAPPYASLLEKPEENFKIAVPTCWNEAPHLQDEVKNDFQEQLENLDKLGLEVNFVTLPHFKDASLVATMICAVEAFSNLSNMDGVRFGHRETGKHLQEMYIETRSRGFSSKLKKFITFGGLTSTPKYYDTFFRRGQKLRTLISRELESCLAENDLLLTPSTPFKAPSFAAPVSGKEFPDPAGYYTAAANLSGFPALSFPLFYEGRLPGNLQFIAPRKHEAALLQIASLLEKEFSSHRPKFALSLQEV